MNVVVLGKGGREHALAWKFSLSPEVEKVWVYPGNDGMVRDPKIEFLSDKKLSEGQLLSCLEELAPDFVMVGPEDLLDQGIGDRLRERGLLTIGPGKEGAKLESSKIFSKKIMTEAGIPTAAYEVAQNLDDLKKLKKKNSVIKYDGLAAGKGVFVCLKETDFSEALETIEDQGWKGPFLVEEMLKGQEVSFFYLCDGSRGSYLGHACDYKRLMEADRGPNTGGMGTYTPAGWLPKDFEKKVQDLVVSPLLNTLNTQKINYTGILFIGLMVEQDDFSVLEFNVRMGDPETQVLLPMIDSDLAPVFKRAAEGKLSQESLLYKSGVGIHIVKAADGYPGLDGPIRSGDEIQLKETHSTQHKIFFAGVKRTKFLETAGGRVLGLTHWNTEFKSARERAYGLLENAQFASEQFRTDIAQREVE